MSRNLANNVQHAGKGRRKTRRTKQAATQGGAPVSQTMLRRIPIFPIHREVTGQLYYERDVPLAPSGPNVVIYNFSANGAYDPNITSTGHQPMGFDQMISMYEQYTVLRSHIKVTFVQTTDDHFPVRVAVYLNPDTTNVSIPALVENGLLKTDVIVGVDGYHSVKTLELSCDVPKYFGRSRGEVIADPNLSGTAAANPTEQVYFTIAAWCFDTTSSGMSIYCDVTLSYDIHYWEPRKLPPSS